jgi:hypothetical protein
MKTLKRAIAAICGLLLGVSVFLDMGVSIGLWLLAMVLAIHQFGWLLGSVLGLIAAGMLQWVWSIGFGLVQVALIAGVAYGVKERGEQ